MHKGKTSVLTNERYRIARPADVHRRDTAGSSDKLAQEPTRSRLQQLSTQRRIVVKSIAEPVAASKATTRTGFLSNSSRLRPIDTSLGRASRKRCPVEKRGPSPSRNRIPDTDRRIVVAPMRKAVLTTLHDVLPGLPRLALPSANSCFALDLASPSGQTSNQTAQLLFDVTLSPHILREPLTDTRQTTNDDG
jgi:hypothetical protein